MRSTVNRQKWLMTSVLWRYNPQTTGGPAYGFCHSRSLITIRCMVKRSPDGKSRKIETGTGGLPMNKKI
jgi:hypothetical protein